MTNDQGSPTAPEKPGASEPAGANERPELLTLHQLHAAEYRFQVELNWKRSQYLLALNLAVLVAGGGLLGGSASAGESIVAAAVFGAGVAAAYLAHRIIDWQHEYYRNTRDRLRAIEDQLGLGDRGIGTTARMGGKHIPKGKITPMLLRTVVALGVLDIVGVLVALWQLLCGTAGSQPP